MQALLHATWLSASVADIAISGLPGWVAVVAGDDADIEIRVLAPVGVEAYIRQPIPCPTPVSDIL